MDLGMIGLGRMGSNMTERLLLDGHRVVVYTRNVEKVENMVKKGAVGSFSLEELVGQLNHPRAIWIMIPAGDPIDQIIQKLLPLIESGDVIIDGGNSNYKDSLRRASMINQKGIHFVDVGTSGGIWGLAEGYCMMIGGEKDVVERLRPVFETLAPGPDKGWDHVGPIGSGHFVKMVHNGIEYGLMQSYAEGFSLLKRKNEFNLNLHQIAELWRFGSVVRSWLLDLTAQALAKDSELHDIAPYVADSGMGRWMVSEAIDLDTAVPVITLSLLKRLSSRDKKNFTDKLLAILRNQFGGHDVKREE